MGQHTGINGAEILRSGPCGRYDVLVKSFLRAWPRVLSGAIILCASLVFAAPVRAATLDDVRERGYLVCAAANPLPGFTQRSAEGLWSGFDVDFCRAVAAAALGDPDLVEFRPLSGNSRFAQLQTGEVDLIARNAAWTASRDSGYGAHYVATSFFDGQAFMVPQALGFVSAYELDEITVCVVNGSDDARNMREFFFETQATYSEVTYDDREDLGVAYRAGLCNVVSAPASWLYGIKRRLDDPTTHRILPERISRLPLGPVVRQDDDEWFNIVRWTLFVLINAEELGVTQRNLESMSSARTPAIRRLLGIESDFGSALRLEQMWMQNVIAAVGNYGEMFDRNFGPQTGAALLRGLNANWIKGGLMVAPPVR